MPESGSADQQSGAFARAFLPGLVLGLVIGGVCGAVLPPLIDGGPRLQRNANTGASVPAGDRERDADEAAQRERDEMEGAIREAEQQTEDAENTGGDAPAPPEGVDPGSDG